MASIASTGAADARPACGSRSSPPRRAPLSGRHQEAGLPDAAAVEAMLAIALLPATLQLTALRWLAMTLPPRSASIDGSAMACHRLAPRSASIDGSAMACHRLAPRNASIDGSAMACHDLASPQRFN